MPFIERKKKFPIFSCVQKPLFNLARAQIRFVGHVKECVDLFQVFHELVLCPKNIMECAKLFNLLFKNSLFSCLNDQDIAHHMISCFQQKHKSSNQNKTWHKKV